MLISPWSSLTYWNSFAWWPIDSLEGDSSNLDLQSLSSLSKWISFFILSALQNKVVWGGGGVLISCSTMFSVASLHWFFDKFDSSLPVKYSDAAVTGNKTTF